MALFACAVVSVFIYIDTRAASTIVAAVTPTEPMVPLALTSTATPFRTSTFAAATTTPPSPTLTPFPVPPLPPVILGRPSWSAALLLTPLRHGDTSRAAVYLTFDDGYGFPDQILQVLQEKHVRATACLVGSFVVARRAFVQHWVEAGDTLCNHSYTHAHLVPRIVSRCRHAVASAALAEEATMHESTLSCSEL